MNICYLALSIDTRREARNLQCGGCYRGLGAEPMWGLLQAEPPAAGGNWVFGVNPPSAGA